MQPTEWNQVRISPSKLGALVNPECCHRCYWMLLRMKFSKPFSFPMPGILNSLDLQHKRLADIFTARDGKLPAYFKAFSDAVSIMPFEDLAGFHEETGLTLYGKPDLVLCDEAGHLSVVDNKSAQPKGPDHALSATYRAQVNFYGYILERLEAKYTISRVGVLYYAVAELTDDEIYANTGADNMWALFRPNMVQLDYDPESIVVPLLRKVRELIDSTEAPDGRDGCKDCLLLESYQDCMSVKDSSGFRLMDNREKQEHFYRNRFLASSVLGETRQLELDSLPTIAALIRPLGVLAQWT